MWNPQTNSAAARKIGFAILPSGWTSLAHETQSHPAILAKVAIYLLSLFLAHESLEYRFAELRFLGGITLFSKLCPTSHSIEPNHF